MTNQQSLGPSEKPSQNKVIVVFTNFWDAEFLLDKKVLVEAQNVIKLESPRVYSIALSHPPFEKLPRLEGLFSGRIDCFCPTYDMLKEYKEGKNWVKYVKKYRALLVNRKERIKEWVVSLSPNYIYLLCCWEDTSGKAHCHRKIIYEAFIASEFMKQRIIPIYRTGRKTYNETSKQSIDPYPAMIQMQPMINPPMLSDPQIVNTQDALDEITRSLTVPLSNFINEDELGEGPENDDI